MSENIVDELALYTTISLRASVSLSLSVKTVNPMSLDTLSSYSREQLSEVLRILKAYKTGLVQIGHRARLIDSKESEVLAVRVEYPSGVSLVDIQAFAVGSLKEYFSLVKKSEDIVFVEVPSLIGGIKIFAWDDMVDVSFQRFANQIKNI